MQQYRHFVSKILCNILREIIYDEAHHTVAPLLKRVIQYFDTDFIIGLTVTDQKPNRKKLVAAFGTYLTSLSLKEVMEKGVVTKANVYRIETNMVLSKVRFNGKDYVNADMEKRIQVIFRVIFPDDRKGLEKNEVSVARRLKKLLRRYGCNIRKGCDIWQISF